MIGRQEHHEKPDFEDCRLPTAIEGESGSGSAMVGNYVLGRGRRHSTYDNVSREYKSTGCGWGQYRCPSETGGTVTVVKLYLVRTLN